MERPMSHRPARATAAPVCSPSRGVGLIELLVCLAISVVLLASAMQAMRGLGSRHTVEATAALLETDLRHARSQALANDQPVRFEVQTLPAPQPAAVATPAATCYVVYSGPAGSCSCRGDGTAQCQPGSSLWRAAAQPIATGVRVLHSGRALTFDPGKGTVTPTATLVVADADGQAIHQVVNIMGRVRSCSPQGLAGLRPCA